MEPLSLPRAQWGLASRTKDGGPHSGDAHLLVPAGDRVLLAVADGLGHGREAGVAARLCLSTMETHPGDPPARHLGRCHESLRGTRGATVTIAILDEARGTLSWLGVGDVRGVLLRADAAASPRRRWLLARNGVVGLRLPPVREAELEVSPGDTVVLATDGVEEAFADALDAGTDPQAMADGILDRFGRGWDDALVLVVRYAGRTT